MYLNKRKDAITKKDDLITFMENNGGRTTTKAAREAGFPNTLLTSLVNQGLIEQESRGIYALADTMIDDFAVLSLRWPRAVFSYGSALYLHGLSDRAPANFDITLPRGYNAESLTGEYPGIRLHFTNKQHFEIGLADGLSPTGTKLKLYDIERCICDLIKARRRGTVDTQLLNSTFREYFSRREQNLPKLTRYAKQLGVEDDLRVYTEVMT